MDNRLIQNHDNAEKKRDLFLQQVETLNIFLGNGALTRAQYDKSLHDLAEKMGFLDEFKNIHPPRDS